jgi:hypothetical protein
VIELLIVHQDAEVGQPLVQMVKDYTGHETALTSSESETLVWLRRQPDVHPRILLTQLDGQGLDGLALAAMLSEMYPGLQTLFCPDYLASDQRMEIVGSKIFPEPIDGERLVAAIERSVRMLPGAPDYFHALDILQMCCLARRSGAVQLVSGSQIGTVYLNKGRIVYAQTRSAEATEAMQEIVSWNEVEFAYDRSVVAPEESLHVPWDQLLTDAVEQWQRRALPDWRRTA